VSGSHRHSVRDVLHLLRDPDAFLAAHLRAGRPLWPQVLAWFAPVLLVRPAAVFVRSLVMDIPITAMVLAGSSLALQVGAWLAVGSALPPLARQFGAPLQEREGLLLAGFASVPLWLAGALFVVPESVPLAFWWSRSLVFVLALYGLFIAFRAFAVQGASIEARWPLVAALAATYAAVYLVLFVLIGLSSHAVLFLLGAR
jgi:hypothetical protein